MSRLDTMNVHLPCFRWLLVLSLVSAFLPPAPASIFYSGHTLPVPIHRTYYESAGEQRLTGNRFEVSVIVQEDILERKQCECIPKYLCRSPRNIIILQSRDCHHHEKVCCET
ncbi:AAEL002592-PA [Aedes aegypti]|uniref:Possible HHH motif antimicrobial peptide n=2 Tax=Aedes aegypti TaxID=7159 RepID=Q1HQT5_AEDAE|nr:uncharacterized protein LOC5575336 [Aedes aegypti]ABF18392.1 possible HHH motif antimicrobial peptide [Aedes aegypti]EAT46199.1 AAEL002592-PA [Aedes aegypti]